MRQTLISLCLLFPCSILNSGRVAGRLARVEKRSHVLGGVLHNRKYNICYESRAPGYTVGRTSEYLRRHKTPRVATFQRRGAKGVGEGADEHARGSCGKLGYLRGPS